MPHVECKVVAIHFFLLKNNLSTSQSGQYKSATIFPPALPTSYHIHTITLIGYFPILSATANTVSETLKLKQL